MFRSAKFWLIFTGLALLAGITYFLVKGHSVPTHARYIPNDAAGVITINTKRLAADVIFSKELKPDTSAAGSRAFQKWKKALEENGGAGLSLTADILLFACNAGNHDYTALVMRVSDEKILRSFLSSKLPVLLDTIRTHASVLTQEKGYTSMVVVNDDDRPLWIGFNSEALVMLRSGSTANNQVEMSNELKRVFTEGKENSILTNHNFVNSESRSADVALWVNYQHPVFKLLNGSGNTKHPGPAYLQAWLDFNKGEIKLEVLADPSQSRKKNIFKTGGDGSGFMSLVDKDKFMGLLHLNLNLVNLFENLGATDGKSNADKLVEKMGITASDISSAWTGEGSVALNGFTHYTETYITTEYDENFNETKVEKTRDALAPSFIMQLSIDPVKAATVVLPKLVTSGKLVAFKNGYKFQGQMPVYLFPSGNTLFITSAENPPNDMGSNSLKNEELNGLLKGHAFSMYIPTGNFEKQLIAAGLYQDHKAGMSDKFESITFSSDENEKDQTQSMLRIRLKNKENNSLSEIIQLLNEVKKNNAVKTNPGQAEASNH